MILNTEAPISNFQSALYLSDFARNRQSNARDNVAPHPPTSTKKAIKLWFTIFGIASPAASASTFRADNAYHIGFITEETIELP